MLKSGSFWKTFFSIYLAIVVGIWGFLEAYTYFEGDTLKQLLGQYWLVIYLLPLFFAFTIAALRGDKTDAPAETLDQRNRRVMLNHVENFWVKGVLEKSLHGAALLELGIKEDPSAVSYPWGIKREATGETLPEGKPMLEIFTEIGMGRSLLILGAPGSGKTTMLLELARQMIGRARKDETEPIPVVFNLSSWNEKQTLADWLAEQLNTLYYVPRKIAPNWVNENCMLLLLDGLDEVKQANREKCVEAINKFRNEHGLTSLVVCSRIQEYEELNKQLALGGAITIQPLLTEQIFSYFDKFGESLGNIKRLLKEDEVLRDLAETPLLLSIMALAYKNSKPEELPTSETIEEHRNHIFNTYTERMFARSTRPTDSQFTKQKSLHYLRFLASKMIEHNQISYQIETMQPTWLVGGKSQNKKWLRRLFLDSKIIMVDSLKWSWKRARDNMRIVLAGGLVFGLGGGLLFGLSVGLGIGLLVWILFGFVGGVHDVQIEEATRPGQRLERSLMNFIIITLSSVIIVTIIDYVFEINDIFQIGLIIWLLLVFPENNTSFFDHYVLRFFLVRNGFLPRRLIPFLEYAVELILLRRIGSGYIFIHRTLMEHFAEMELETTDD